MSGIDSERLSYFVLKADDTCHCFENPVSIMLIALAEINDRVSLSLCKLKISEFVF